MKARVHVMLKNGVLDPQGEAVRHALGALGFDKVEGVRQGKVIDLELAEGATDGHVIDLNVSKTVGLIREAMVLQTKGFEIPVPPMTNANFYDRAYEELNRRTNGLSHRVRSGDDFFPIKSFPKCGWINGVSDMLWGELARKCPWSSWVGRLIRDLDL